MQKNTTKLLGATLLVLAMTQAAHAGAPSLEPVEGLANTVQNFMTGAFARTAGAIAIAFIGYRWFTGRLELGKALTIAGGIVLILGAPAIVDFIDSGVGGA